MKQLVLACGSLALGACAAAGSSPQQGRDWDDWEDFARRSERDRGPSREWIAVAVSSVDRRGSDSDLVDDSAAFTLEGGYDLLATDVVHAGLEIGVVWSRHETEVVTGTNDDPRLSVTRWNLGGRVALGGPKLPFVVYGDGGIYVRSEDSSDEPTLEQDGRGNYIGGGIEFWFDASGRVGPFVRAYDFADSDLNETLIGVTATFAF